MNDFRLQIELVPANAWGRNLRKQVRDSIWKKLRAEVFANAKNRCEICGADGKLNCHEVWSYDDKNHIQRLTALQAVCQMCHHVSHYGMSQILAAQGYLDLREVDKHFLRVNRATLDDLEKHKKEAYTNFLRRSRIKWKIHFGKWQPLWAREHEFRQSK